MSLTGKRLVSTGNLTYWGLTAKDLVGYMSRKAGTGGGTSGSSAVWLLQATFPQPLDTFGFYINPSVNKVSFPYFVLFGTATSSSLLADSGGQYLLDSGGDYLLDNS